MIMAYRIAEEEYQAINVKGKETKGKRISKKLTVLMLRYEEKVHCNCLVNLVNVDVIIKRRTILVAQNPVDKAM